MSEATTSRVLIRAVSRSLRDYLASASLALKRAGIPDSRIEAEVLLRCTLGVGRGEFLGMLYGGDFRLSEEQSDRFECLLDRRLDREPLAYIVGRREFYGIEFEVSEDTLIPRQETELLVEVALERMARVSCAQVVDVGTGPGAVALAIAANAGRGVSVVATDVSAAALEVARRNAARLGLSERVEFVQCDMLDGARGPFDVVVSNPPYIPSGDIEELAVEVRREPRIALDGGADGLDPFRKLMAQASSKLAIGGMVAVELMPEQMDAARSIAADAIGANGGNREINTRKDLSGSERAIIIRPLNSVSESGEAT